MPDLYLNNVSWDEKKSKNCIGVIRLVIHTFQGSEVQAYFCIVTGVPDGM